MKLLRIRDYFINIDLVQTAKLEDDAIVLTISGQPFRFSGGDATLISNWLSRFALDLNHGRSSQNNARPVENRANTDWENAPPRGGLFRKYFAS